jgi:hypothetical protein
VTALVITVIQLINAAVGAAFSALLLRASVPVWRQLDVTEKWLAAALFVYSANIAVFSSLFWISSGRSWINVGFLFSLLAAHRYLYFVRRDTRP